MRFQRGYFPRVTTTAQRLNPAPVLLVGEHANFDESASRISRISYQLSQPIPGEGASQLTNIASVSIAALIAVWFGYPAVIWLLARLFPRRAPAAAGVHVRLPRVSVIIASRDEAHAIRERVRDALSGDYPSEYLEVVVARDAAVANVGEHESLTLPHGAQVIPGDAPGGKAAALNAAVRAATGDVLVFTDTAQRFMPNAVRTLVAALHDERYGAVSGALRLRSDDSGAPSLAERYWRFERWLRGEEAIVHSAVGVTGAVYAMRRSDWRPVPAGVLCDDLYIPMELVLRGRRIGFCRDAEAVDERRFEAAQEYQRKVRTLTGVLQVCVWLPAVLLPIRNPIWLQFVFHKLLRLLTPYLVLVALLAALGALSRAMAPSDARLPLLAIALGAPLLVWALSRRARAALAMGLAMQLAVVRATWNGLRGDWDVWRR